MKTMSTNKCAATDSVSSIPLLETKGIFLKNYADGVEGHYYIGRNRGNPPNEWVEYWNVEADMWTAFGTCFDSFCEAVGRAVIMVSNTKDDLQERD
jgi:hypothetical protein